MDPLVVEGLVLNRFVAAGTAEDRAQNTDEIVHSCIAKEWEGERQRILLPDLLLCGHR